MASVWPTTSAWMSLALCGLGAVTILADIYLAGNRQQMRIREAVWPINALYLGPFAIWAHADRRCDLWLTQDAGLWELQINRHCTESKMGCWVALDRALRLHDAGQLADTHAEQWRSERDTIRAWVNQHCWSETEQAYTFYAGTDDLHTAVLLAGQNGFDRGERLTGTIAAIRRGLADGPLVYRYTGMQQAEGAFLACSCWLASALANLGRTDEATAQMGAAAELAGDLGLFAEQITPDLSMLGNAPQGLSHLALINAAFAIHRAGSRR